MYGNQQHFGRGDGGRRHEAQSPPQPQQIHLNSNFFPDPYLYLLQQNPNFQPSFNYHLQQNYTAFPPIQQHFLNTNFSIQATHSNGSGSNQHPQQQQRNVQNKEMIEKVDKAAERSWKDLLQSNENVSAWVVSQAALRTVKADSWESLGFQMQRVPSLNRLLAAEGKVNAFIHCFVAARRITSLYDLEMAICENEGIERFEELELGPLVRHPLAIHYYSLTSVVTEVCRIRTEDIIFHLCEFIDIHKKKEVTIDALLDFISNKLSVSGQEKLCIRIKNLGLYIHHIMMAKRSEHRGLEKCYEKLRTKSETNFESTCETNPDKRSGKLPLISVQKKKKMDDHFTKISERVKSFSSENTEFCGKHIRFVSSSSDDDDALDAGEHDNNQDEDNKDINPISLPSVGLDLVSSCPYPSATEERKRLGLKNVDSSPRMHNGGARYNLDNVPPRKKRKYEHMSSSTTLLVEQFKKDKFKADIKHGGHHQGIISPVSVESLRNFFTTWKEVCQVNNADEVLEKMLQFYDTKRKGVKRRFKSYPFAGLLYAAVTYIKLGKWDNICVTFQQTFSEHGLDDRTHDSSAEYRSIDVQSAKKNHSESTPRTCALEHEVAVEDIMKKVSGYFEDDILSYENSSLECRFGFLRKLYKCEYWLMAQYSVDKFESLGHGEYFVFLQKHIHLLPQALLKCIIGGRSENVTLEAHLLPIQLGVFMSQAFDSLRENEVDKRNISELLARQFPLVCFELVNSDILPSLADIIREKRHNFTSNSVLFSTPLSALPAQNERRLEELPVFGNSKAPSGGMNAAVTTKDAIEVLLKAPMLTDLNLWLHWDISFAPYLGPIVQWLLKEVNNKELLCLITKDGKVIRVDHSTTLNSFLKVFIQVSPFKTAVALLSLCVLYGGVENVPLSLLKCHAQQGFKVIINNYLETELHNDKHPLLHANPSSDLFGNSTSTDLCIILHSNKSIHNKVAAVMSRFILDCLSCLPVEFCSFAADILISGLQSFVKDVPSVIVNECNLVQQRLMLHEVGMSLGLVEWVNDYHSFCSPSVASYADGSSCINVIYSEFGTRSITDQELGKHKEMLVSGETDFHDIKCKLVSCQADYAEVPVDSQASNIELVSMLGDHAGDDPAGVIESIRRDEFALEQFSAADSKMLEKQHARLGRALHCLSQELYSQDSHYLLELVQNADDNTYPESVEPTLVFILLEKSIIVLNNEKGFSANDVRALCDVGNSTKKDHVAGYIGKKGIGFKSVFRITDAPEIHSNGYHIKFDITKGQIGFVLPTVVPPCDIDLYTRWASADADHVDRNFGNTCIVLPFRSNILEGLSVNHILSMFSDLHPSLLLFLHRLKCIRFRNMLDDSLIVMRKEVIGDGIVEVALGNKKMTWFVVSRKLKADVISSEMRTTEISAAFTLQEAEGYYSPVLNQQPVFAFLPLRTYGLKFILQGDFSLTSSREEVDANSPWNQWLLSDYPDLFVDAEKSFCNLPCYRGNPGKAITVFMSFVPLLGEVHGFFSCLPRMIISKLRISNCLILEGDEKEWVPPCKVLRNWTEQTRALIPDSLLQEHLGLGFLHRDIVLSDSLAKALGVEDYGPKILLGLMSSLCSYDNGLKSMGVSWISSWLSTMYVFLFQSFMQTSPGFGAESNFIQQLQRIPFIPLSDGKYSSLDEGSIWLHSEGVGRCITDEGLLNAFPKLYVKLRIVSPNLLAAATSIENSYSDASIKENVASMLFKVGVQQLSFHDIVKVHILPGISDDKSAVEHEELMIEYLAFAMFHLQSGCSSCSLERSGIVERLREKALILTNYGFKRSTEVPIHFTRVYESSVDVNKLISGLGIKWHELDSAYLKHSITKSISGAPMKWRNFFQEIGVTDFVQVVQVEKSVPYTSFVNTNKAMHIQSTTASELVSKNWASEELFDLLSALCSRDDGFKSKYLLEILDRLWDDCFSDKVTGYFVDSNGESKLCRSSFISILQDFPWIASSLDNKLHYPTDLFHDCIEVHSVLGVSAPYTVPRVRSEKLMGDIGLKLQVTLDDVLYVLQLWKRSGSSFKASISQMSNFYTFLWKGMTHSKKKIMDELQSGPFIFVPSTSDYLDDDVVPGMLLSPHEVYWHYPMGSIDQMKIVQPECVTSVTCNPYSKMLYKNYPNLHDFFVKECGVDESPPFCSYLQILLQLSSTALPHQAAKKVFVVFLMWDDALKSGSLSFEDVEYLKESLLKMEYTVLPTRQDKWVSLHPSFGLICWCDDDILRKEFRHLPGIDFLYFGESTDEQNQILETKVLTVVQRLGISALSEVVSREAVYYGTADNSFIYSLLNWVLPYAQRYIYSMHPDKYLQLKDSDFQSIRNLKIFVVEKLYYRNIIKKHKITSGKRYECNCLLQDNILYCSRESDPHSLFLELSGLFYSGKPELHFANFLHMITTMAESGTTEEQTEFFILNSQRMPQLPSDESRWSLRNVPSPGPNGSAPLENLICEQSSSQKRKSSTTSNWPPADWRTAPGFNSVSSRELKKLRTSCSNEHSIERTDPSPTDIINEVNIEVDPTDNTPVGIVLLDAESESQSNISNNMTASGMGLVLESVDIVRPDSRIFLPSNYNDRDQAIAQQALLTGRLGELVAFKYFRGKEGQTFVKWVNETNETGLPYDIILGDDEVSREYVEVKSTISARKNWFLISVREWQFAIEKGEAFSIAHVFLKENNMAKVTIYKNPARLLKLGNLKLAMVVSNL